MRTAPCRLRPWHAGDVADLPGLAGAPEVARFMSQRFPHPYTAEDARTWILFAAAQHPTNDFAIEADGRVLGGAGLQLHAGEYAGVAELGYWLGRAHWGCGYATQATSALVRYAFDRRNVRRLEARLFVSNHASSRVLEKCGFVREAYMRSALVERDGTVADALLYARVRSA